MKKILALVFLSACFGIVSAQNNNVFPATGNVGIGTTNPAAKISFNEVSESDMPSGLTWFSGAPLSYGIYRTAGAWLAPAYQQMKLQWDTGIILDPGAGSQKSYVDIMGGGLRVSSGYVGIGITSPNQRLSVAGNIFASVGSNEGPSLILENPSKNANAAGYRWILYNMTGSYGNSLQFWNYNQDNSVMGPKFTISDNGNVLIGKTSQTNTAYMLDVNGKARANEIVVNTTGADFVFENDYKLRSLKDVEAFVKQNKHLPEVPSAKAMQENGLGVSEMQTKLLQKVEELTLYLIEQNKRIAGYESNQQKQQNEIEKLKKLLYKK
ncbi:hypothetical protein DBR40_00995 [Pedobacter sp. KBW01]|uniref:hypothetical protein n=1 Tax=Pedobacter sp. KBW01 TaxID=2153364 RepID=UPI000F598CAB|nr:hypothetical protein [Pedobacter sp. KBW01]RQO80225.1 hypothetical protein DBR40_00995 [Pedobacter sp. KBW01]